jgi:hypothetical protein
MKRKNIIRVVFTLLILIQSSFAFAQEKMDLSGARYADQGLWGS